MKRPVFDFSDWPEIVASGLLAVALTIAVAGDYRSAAIVGVVGALAAVEAVRRSLS